MSAALAKPAARERAPRARASYENWRPPVIGVSLLVPVGADGLLPADMTGRGDLVIPAGSAEDGETPEQAAQRVLLGSPSGLRVLRRVAVDQVQMRRRKVITHIVATLPLTYDDVVDLAYRDPRAVLVSVPTARAVAGLPGHAGHWALLGLGCLATGVVAHLERGVVRRLEAAPLRQ